MLFETAGKRWPRPHFTKLSSHDRSYYAKLDDKPNLFRKYKLAVMQRVGVLIDRPSQTCCQRLLELIIFNPLRRQQHKLSTSIHRNYNFKPTLFLQQRIVKHALSAKPYTICAQIMLQKFPANIFSFTISPNESQDTSANLT